MVDRSDRYCVVLFDVNRHVSEHKSDIEKRMAQTNAPSLHPFPMTSPHITSLGIHLVVEASSVLAPAVLAISKRLRLLSSPMVHTLPGGRSNGSGRYLPLPVPASRPTEPVGNVDINMAIIGHGLYKLKMSRLNKCGPMFQIERRLTL
jgi:hypothetical protein